MSLLEFYFFLQISNFAFFLQILFAKRIEGLLEGEVVAVGKLVMVKFDSLIFVFVVDIVSVI